MRIESLESRLLLHAGHEMVFPAAEPAAPLNPPLVAPTPVAANAASGQPMLPDIFPLVSEEDGYVYGWEYDLATLPGRTLLRLTTAMGNRGAGPLKLNGGAISADGTQEVYQQINLSGGGSTQRLAGNFVYHPEHEHVHFDNFAAYRLRGVTASGDPGDVVASGDKISFCLLDIDHFDAGLPGSPFLGIFIACGQTQGISVGWADVYDKSLPDQWIDVTGVADGDYWIEVVSDPDNRLLESDETNNTSAIRIALRKPSPDPMVVAHDPAGQYPVPVGAVDFKFDQPMNPSSFSLAEDVAAFTGPGGADLRGQLTGFSWPDDRTLRIAFAMRTTLGPYTMTIGPNINSADDGAPMDQDRDKTAGERAADQYSAAFNVDNRLGPDAYGYDARAVPLENIDLALNTPGVFVLIDNADDGSAPARLGSNTFNFYGVTYTGNSSLFVTSNGLITMGKVKAAFANDDLVDYPEDPSIAVLWDDLHTDQTAADVVLGRFDDLSGDGVPDRLIVEWSDVRRHNDPGPVAATGLTFQAILSLNTGDAPGEIIFNYRDLDTASIYTNGASATVGIKDGGDTRVTGNRLLVSYNRGDHPFIATGRAIRIARAPASVVGRRLYYNRSAFDGESAYANAQDDAAIARDKFAYGLAPTPGGRATFANVSGYSRGINGLMIDIAGLQGRTPQAADFEFRTGVTTLAAAPDPTITVRRGAGVAGSDRITLVWPDNAIRDTWLRVTVRPTANTGIAAADIFTFGHLAGDTGSGGTVGASVDVVDIARTRGAASPGAVTSSNPFDHNRDGFVNAFDLGVTRANLHTSLPWLGAGAKTPPPSTFANQPIGGPAVRDLSTRRTGLLVNETLFL